jgi:tetratricopeptide (TPR) repeat protein
MFMLRRLCVILTCTAASLTAQEDPASTIPQLTKDGDSLYLKGDYEGARLAFASAWELAQHTPTDNPVRYDILKRLTSVRAAAGEFADADNWLQLAINWRENTLGQKDPKIADDLLILVGLCRGMKDFDRALVVLRRVKASWTRRKLSIGAGWRCSIRRTRSTTISAGSSTACSKRWTLCRQNPRRRHGRRSLRRRSRPYRPAISMPSFLSSSE